MTNRRQTQLIPVLDVMGGQVVRAAGGRREEYRPVESRLTRSTHPLEVAGVLCGPVEVTQLYVGDLDAIRGGAGVSPSVAELIEQFKFPFWVDLGIDGQRTASLLAPWANAWPVVALETASEPRYLAETLTARRTAPIAFSLDLNAGQLLGNWPAWGARHPGDALGVVRTAVELGTPTLIVLDLARVGTGTGAGTVPLLKAIRREFPDVDLIAGGGVKTWDDVDRLGDAGADAVLVASALHDGTLKVPRAIG